MTHHRSIQELLATHTHATPRPPAPQDRGVVRPHRVNRARATRRGPARPGRGWSPIPAPLPVSIAGTHVIGGLFPLLSGTPLPAVGARIGYDAHSGSAVYCHPVEWVLRSVATNPNIALFGEPGTGKSALIKALLVRWSLFGIRTLIAGDVKGEYTPIVRALGAEPIMLGSRAARLNALDLGPLARRWDGWTATRQREELDTTVGRWVQLLTALAQAQGYHATVTDETVLATVLRHLTGAAEGCTRLALVTVPDVHRALAAPADALWRDLRFADRRQFLDHLRALTDALGNLISGPLAGILDGPTTVEVDWDAPVQSMDLSALRHRGDHAIAVALTCLGSWSVMATAMQSDGQIRCVVRDEIWRQMRLGLRAVQTVDGDLRLSRTDRTIQILASHKPTDFLSVGDAGSQEVAIARDLMSLASTRILFGQSTRVADDLAEDLALSDTEQDALTGWATGRVGRALWKIESTPARKVHCVLSHLEHRLFDTNTGLRPPVPDQGTPGGRAP